MGFWVEAHASVPHIGETGQRPYVDQMIGDPEWPEKDKRRNPRCARSQTVETAEYSCSLELEPHSFLIVHAVVRHNVGGGDCMTARRS